MLPFPSISAQEVINNLKAPSNGPVTSEDTGFKNGKHGGEEFSQPPVTMMKTPSSRSSSDSKVCSEDMTIDPKNNPGVGFSEDGLRLELRDSTYLSNKVLPKYFKHRNISSFIRQLHNYGFKAVPIMMTHTLSHCFIHDCFQKGKIDLLVSVLRRASASNPTKPSAETTKEINRKHWEYDQRISQLLQMNEDLRQQNQDLQEVNKRLKVALMHNQGALRNMIFERQQQRMPYHTLHYQQVVQVISQQETSSHHCTRRSTDV